MNTTTPANKISNNGATAQGRLSMDETNDIINTVNSKQDRDSATFNPLVNIITPDVTAKYLLIATLAANATVANPVGTKYDGQQIRFRFIQAAGGGFNITTWGTQFYFTDQCPVPDLSQSLANQIDYVDFAWNAAKTKWECMGWFIGYGL